MLSNVIRLTIDSFVSRTLRDSGRHHREEEREFRVRR
jgi:hypothetical protein